MISSLGEHFLIWPKIRKELESKYEIIDCIDLLENNVDLELTQLYKKLSKFSEVTFDNNQRIVILYRDTDYYCNDTGFTIWNLYKICSALDLPCEFIILITASYDITEENLRISNEFNLSPMQVMYCPYQYCPIPENVINISDNKDKIIYPYACINGVPRAHRIYTLAKLKEQQIFDNGMISLWPENPYNNSKIKNLPVTDEIPTLHLRTTFPPTRFNNHLTLNKNQSKIFHGHYDQIFQKTVHPDITGEPNNRFDRYQPDFLQLAFWNLITETVGEYPYSYFTEKTFKAILTKRPFILLGGGNSLELLRKLGFKTFGQWIDESYSDMPSFADRADSAIENLKPFCFYTTDQLQKVYNEMQETIEYNFDHYKNKFGGTDLDYFIRNML